ncbi:hypothetical protein SAMN05444156_3196 [Verrucomicrobium sp. GAS474]|nr:hypothetical protein SAMN05444156_3196 [Verrucomicrobium sp. GAS474]
MTVRLERWTWAAAILLGLGAVAFLLWHIARPYPVEASEPSHILNTVLFVQGINPYAVPFHPEWLYVYGTLHNAVAYPFALLFGPTFLLHRILSCLCLLLATGVLYRGMRLDRISPALAGFGALLFFIHFAFSVTITAKGNAVAILCYLLSVVVPYAGRFRPGSLAAGALFSVLAFYSKGYLALGAPLVSLYLFFFQSRRLGLLSAAFFGFFLLASAAVVRHFFPLFLEESVLYQYYWTRAFHDRLHLFVVMKEVVVVEAALLALLAWGLWRGKKGSVEPFAAFLLAGSFLVYVAVLSPNKGNGSAYVYHLVLPFLIWAALLVVSRNREALVPRVLLLASVALVALFVGRPALQYGHGDHRAAWERVGTLLRAHHDPLCDGSLSESVRAAGLPVYDNGLTEGLRYVTDNPSVPETRLHKAEARAYCEAMTGKLKAKGFDLLLLYPEGSPFFPRELIPLYYRKVDSFSLWESFPNDFKSNIEVWEPLP